MEDLLKVGVITTTHGVRGEVKVFPTTDEAERFLELDYVLLEDGTVFGTLKDVMETGANDVYVIDTKDRGEVLLPAIRECILDVNVEESTMTVHLMKGLL